ncbi:uncharacterized protein BX664DRAFT_135521 [Halteromyces radiatus]|uniref:uncharacterized protein n=1 Tax=Halteromyces radiatus TaxID=101107 RepID=UPI00221E7EAB|nr:uncharacterized protein BX664DRAFT_135521 [Halteromyces radiatus]KAI8089514.1 hypothetical protein BX664DRAFT_135521 [Halteromyces radiatus]
MTDNNDNNYLAMLNNPVINPPVQQQPLQPSLQSTAPCITLFPAAQQCQDKLQTNDLYLVSETDAPWLNVAVPWSSDSLPSQRSELEQAGLLVRNTHVDRFDEDDDEENGFRIKTVDAFFEPLIKPGPQSKEYNRLLQQIKDVFENNVKVYLVGNRVITVLILGLVQDESEQKALVGLQSELVQT